MIILLLKIRKIRVTEFTLNYIRLSISTQDIMQKQLGIFWHSTALELQLIGVSCIVKDAAVSHVTTL